MEKLLEEIKNDLKGSVFETPMLVSHNLVKPSVYRAASRAFFALLDERISEAEFEKIRKALI